MLDFTNCFKTENQNECCYFKNYCKKQRLKKSVQYENASLA